MKSKHIIILFASLLVAALAWSFAVPAASGASGESECIPQEAWTETIEHEEVSHEEAIFDHWQRYSWTGGPWESTEAPPFPDERWQANVEGDPHGVGVEGAYFRSHGNSGKGDWFYLEAVEKTITVIDHEAWTETIEHDAVTCDEEEPVIDECVDPETGEDLCVHEEPETEEPETEEPEGPEGPETPTVNEPLEDDQVVEVMTHSTPSKVVKTYVYESGAITRSVKRYKAAELNEEGM